MEFNSFETFMIRSFWSPRGSTWVKDKKFLMPRPGWLTIVALSSTVEGMDYTDLEWIVGINFWGVVHGTKAFLPYLKASGDGHIINTSSVFGLFAQPGMSGYNATKFAVRGFTEALRAFTLDAAYAAHQEDSQGTLEPGKWADFILIDQDIFKIDPARIWKTRVLQTWVAGKSVYQPESATQTNSLQASQAE